MKLIDYKKAMIDSVESALKNHAKYSKAYFFKPPSYANARRREEKLGSRTIKVEYDGDEYIYSSELSVSCNHYYYSAEFTINGEKKDVRLFKRLKKELEDDLKFVREVA